MNLRGGIACAAICFCLAASLAACANQTASPPEPIPAPAAPAPPPPPPVSAAPETSARPSKTVKASYQGTSTAGRTTASGEPYDPKALTAASRTLPIGSTVKVTNPDTGRSVKVRINDRGPFAHGRSLDLSKSAAEKIGITDKGVAKVKVTPASSHPAADQSESPSAAGTPAP
jgi:rare lipoprotein A